MPNFNTSDGELTDLFITETDILDRYVGNQLWTWGRNTNGQLGDNSAIGKSSPVQTVAAGTNWKLVDCGGYHTAAIKTDGSLWLWGQGVFGALGNNSITADRSSPVQTVSGGTNWKMVSAGSYYTAAIKTDGSLWLWGTNINGRLGDNTIIHRSSPVQTVATGTNWKQVSVGGVSAAIKTNGSLWTWGSNTSGSLGDNSIIHRSSPVQTVSSGTNWKIVSAGSAHIGAIKTDGSLWLWGSNTNGQLGNNSTTPRSSPVQTIAGGTNWKQVSCGLGSYTSAIKTNGSLWVWGDNAYGKLGDNSVISKSSPVQTVAGGTNWIKVDEGLYHTAAIKTDGTLWTWGRGVGLGDNSTTTKSSPVQTVSGGTNWKLVSCGYYHTAVVTYTES